MVTGDKWEMYIPANLAYGDNGRVPGCLVFTMEILQIKGGSKPRVKKASSPPPVAAAARRIVVEESSSEEDDEEVEVVPVPPVVEQCPETLKIKAEGNKHFQGGRYDQAIEAYTRSLEKLFDETNRDDHPEAIKIYSNRAACHSQGGNHRQVVGDCNAALDMDPTAVKALMRRSHAFECLEKFQPALDDMKTVLQLDWSIKEAQTARQRLEGFVRAEHKMNGTSPEKSPAKAKAWTEPATKKPVEAVKKPAAVKPMKPKAAGEKWDTKKKEQPKKRIVVQADSDEDSDDEDEVTPAERTANATNAKDQGNAAFKQRDFGEAVRLYTLAIECKSEDTVLVASLYNNRAMAQLKVGASLPEGGVERFSSFKDALKDTTIVLKEEPGNVKALFRKGQAYMGLDEYEHAARELKQVVKLQPDNKAAKTELAQANAKLAQLEQVNAAMQVHLDGGDGEQEAGDGGMFKLPGAAAPKAGKGPMISEVDSSSAISDSDNIKKSKKKAGKKGGKQSKPLIIEEVDSSKTSKPKQNQQPVSLPRGSPAPLKIPKPSVPTTPPPSSTAFEQQYMRLKKYPDIFFQYMQIIPPASLHKLFRSSITAEMLGAIVKCLADQYIGEHDMVQEAFNVLNGLSKINRMSTTLLAMTDEERGQLTGLLDQMENTAGGQQGFAIKDVATVRAAFV